MMTAEKRVDAVIKWLERLKKSYRSGAVERAYLDAECARAEIEDLRSSIFLGIRGAGQEAGSVRRGGKTGMTGRILVMKGVIIMVMVSPLSREPEADEYGGGEVLAEQVQEKNGKSPLLGGRGGKDVSTELRNEFDYEQEL